MTIYFSLLEKELDRIRSYRLERVCGDCGRLMILCMLYTLNKNILENMISLVNASVTCGVRVS